MALLWVEGFETYGTSGRPSPDAVMSRKYGTYFDEVYDDIVAGRNGYGYQMGSGSSELRTPDITTDRTLITGLAFNIGTVLNTNTVVAFMQRSTLGAYVYYGGAGELSVRMSGLNILGTTTSLGLVSGVWYWLEFKVYCDDSAGTWELRINGVNVLSGTGADTKNSTTINYFSGVRLGTGAASLSYDDWYICDSAGSNNNDFLGDVAVETIYPDSDSSVTWTPDTGATNYTQINETEVDDTDYVEATTGKDLYGYGAVATTNIIYGLMVNTDAELTDTTAFSLKTVASSSAVEDTATYNTLGMGQVSCTAVFEEDPNTSALWLYGDVNSALFGIEVV